MAEAEAREDYDEPSTRSMRDAQFFLVCLPQLPLAGGDGDEADVSHA